MKKKQLVSLALVAAMSLSLCACGSNAATEGTESDAAVDTNVSANDGTDADSEGVEVVDTANATFREVDVNTYQQESSDIYNAVLGEFYQYYQMAEEAPSVSERYALMAIAEAKLLESGVMLPSTTKGGLYAISRVAPNTVDYTLWGNDYERYHQALVATEFITSEDRVAMKEKWSELKGTGTYEEWAKQYLTDAGYTLKDDYSIVYTEDPVTWDVLATSLAVDSEAIINTYDGLMEYDCEGTLQPALAESYEVSDDGLTYTFHIRQGVKWVDSQGRELGDVTADDFVAGMQHMMDAQGGLEYLVEGIIVNASEYIGGTVTDFTQVGVAAADDYTLVYTLEAPCTYFTTMLGYGVFAPMNRAYYVSQGGKFGFEYDPSAADYVYGVDPDHIAYCGPYLVTNNTAKNTIVFSANPTYYNADKINVKTLTWRYSDGTDPTKNYEDAKSGVIDGVSLTTSVLELAKTEGYYDKYSYTSATDATSFMFFYNLNRYAFANVNDATTVVSAQTAEDAMRTRYAMQNVHFRRAISFAADRGAYNAQSVGEDLKYTSLRNSYTPGTFVTLEEDVTIDINGTATTFPAGTFYGAIVQAQIDADGVAIKAWDPSADDGIGSSDGYDGWYNVDAAVAELDQAIAELSAQGIEVSAENPIYIDYPYADFYEIYNQRAQAYKQSVENALGGKVIVSLTACMDSDQWYNSGYLTSYGYEGNYDVFDLAGWGPDYGDPETYLNTMLPDYAGYMTKSLGLF